MKNGPITKPKMQPIGKESVAIDVAIALSSSANQWLIILLTPFMKKGWAMATANWATRSR